MSGVRTIETYVVDAVKDFELPGAIDGCPLTADMRRTILGNCPIYLVDPTEETPNYLAFDPRPPTDAYDAASYDLWRPSEGHIRSFVLGGPGLDTAWQDNFGNFYGAFSLKGINFTRPGVLEHPVTTDGVVAWGLQESKIISRVLAASDVLVRRGVSTERIIGLAEPKEYPWPIIDGHTEAHDYITLLDYKKRIVETYWRQLPEDERTVDTLADLTRKFGEMTFYISLRATDTAVRLGDIRNDTAAARLSDEINTHHLAPGELPYVLTDPADKKRYLYDFFGPRAGRNLAKVHEDLAWRFPHKMNWTGLAGVVDLDSMRGESLGLGDEPIDEMDRAQDIVGTLKSITEMCPRPLGDMRVLTDDARGALEAFLNSYFDETIARLGDSPETVEYLGELLLCFGPVLDVSGEVDDDLGSQFTLTACDLFINRFYPSVHRSRLAETGEATATQMLEAIDADEYLAERMAINIFTGVCGQMDTYANMIIEDHIGELADPDFDVVSHFMASSHSTARSQLIDDIISHIVEFGVGAVPETVPEIIRNVSNPIIQKLLMIPLSVSLRGGIRARAEAIAAQNLPLLENRLRQHCNYTRPESILPGHPSVPCITLPGRRFMMSTQEVPLTEVVAYLNGFSGDLEVAQLPPAQNGEFGFYVARGAAVEEVISPGGVNGVVTLGTGDEAHLELTFVDKDNDYVLLVSRPLQSEPRFSLLVKDLAASHGAKSPAEPGTAYWQPELA